MIKIKTASSALLFMLSSTSLIAAPIAEESGFSGFVAAGITGISFESNMIAGNAFDDEITDNSISSLADAPDTESSVLGNLNYELKYTYAESKTEVFLGTDLIDLLTFDNTSRLGVRKDYDGFGIIGVSLLFTTLPGTVWQDPYDTSKPRNSVDQDSEGISLKWERILESNFELEVRKREYKIDGNDSSGLNGPYVGAELHGLTDAELNDQLNREGDVTAIFANYTWKFGEGKFLKPSLRYGDYDLDGQAMQYKRTAFKLAYLSIGKRWNIVASASVGQDDYDNINPLFADEADSATVGAAFTAAYKNPFGWSKKLSFLGTVAAYDNDSDIDFYDTSITLASFTALYRF